jgi:hypothetical protein
MSWDSDVKHVLGLDIDTRQATLALNIGLGLDTGVSCPGTCFARRVQLVNASSCRRLRLFSEPDGTGNVWPGFAAERSSRVLDG